MSRRVPITDTVGLFVFAVDMWARFNAGLVISNNMRKAVVMDRVLVAEQYILRGPFVFDILTIVPLCIEVRQSVHQLLRHQRRSVNRRKPCSW